MHDNTVKLSLQAAAQEMERRFPGRVFAFFVFPAEEGQKAQYVSNGPREKIIRAMRELTLAGLPGIPGDPSRS